MARKGDTDQDEDQGAEGEAPAVESDDITLAKGDERITVHPTGVQFYLSGGWKVV